MKNDIQIYYLPVVWVDDEEGGLRIKVRVPVVDDIIDPQTEKTISDDKLPWVFPLLPKFVHCNPKIGECVFVFFQDTGKPSGARFFIGPIISQDYHLNYDFYGDATRLIEGEEHNSTQLIQNPKLNENNKGVLIDREDIAIKGRYNSDIILKPNELQLRCCFKNPDKSNDVTNILNYNKVNPAYIQMKYHYLDTNTDNRGYRTYINIVADKINLLSHLSNIDKNLTKADELIPAQDLMDISWHGKEHPLPYGDKIVMLLKGILNLLKTHVHPFPTKPPSYNESDTNFVNFNDWYNVVSHNININ